MDYNPKKIFNKEVITLLIVIVIAIIALFLKPIISLFDPGEVVTAEGTKTLILSEETLVMEGGSKLPDFKNYIKSREKRSDTIIDVPIIDKVGEFEINFTYKSTPNNYVNQLILIVQDTTPPKIMITKDTFDYYEDEEIDKDIILDTIEVSDFSDFKKGISDIPKIVGNHKLLVTVIDSSNNKSEAIIHLNILNREVNDGNYIPENNNKPTNNSNETRNENASSEVNQDIPNQEVPIVKNQPEKVDASGLISSIVNAHSSIQFSSALSDLAASCAYQSAITGSITCNQSGSHGKQGSILSLLYNFNLNGNEFGAAVYYFNDKYFVIVVSR